ncbi:FAR1 DNA binding domain, zinc finger, SWIM-type, MULE transposase domain containing protein [Tanacetum coccineum]
MLRSLSSSLALVLEPPRKCQIYTVSIDVLPENNKLDIIFEQVESIIVAVIEKLLEFVIHCLECSVVDLYCHAVDFCKSELEVECSCKHYEAYGLLCRHICYIGYIGSENKRNLDEELAATKKKNTVKRVADEEYTERRIASKDC